MSVADVTPLPSPVKLFYTTHGHSRSPRQAAVLKFVISQWSCLSASCSQDSAYGHRRETIFSRATVRCRRRSRRRCSVWLTRNDRVQRDGLIFKIIHHWMGTRQENSTRSASRTWILGYVRTGNPYDIILTISINIFTFLDYHQNDEGQTFVLAN